MQTRWAEDISAEIGRKRLVEAAGLSLTFDLDLIDFFGARRSGEKEQKKRTRQRGKNSASCGIPPLLIICYRIVTAVAGATCQSNRPGFFLTGLRCQFGSSALPRASRARPALDTRPPPATRPGPSFWPVGFILLTWIVVSIFPLHLLHQPSLFYQSVEVSGESSR